MRPSHASFALRVFLLCHGGWGGWVRGAEVANHVQCLLRSEVMLWYWSLFLFLPPEVMLLIFVSARATRSDATLLLLHLPSEVILRYWSLLLRLPSEVMLSHAIGFCFYTCPQKPCYPLPIDLCFPTCHQKWWCYAIDFYFNTCHQKWCYPIDLCFSTCTRSDSMLLIFASIGQQKWCYATDLCFYACHHKWCYSIDFFGTCHQKWFYSIDLCGAKLQKLVTIKFHNQT